MKKLLLFVTAVCLGIGRIAAQTATVTPSVSTYDAAGGQITFSVALSYPANVSAVGFAAKPPTATWAHVSTGGANVPGLKPRDGETTDPANTSSEFGWTYPEESGPPATGATFNFVLSYPAGLSGNQVISLSGHTRLAGVRTDYTIAPLTLTPTPVAPSITTHPANVSVASGANTSFTTAANGFPLPTFKWQRSTDNGATFVDLPAGSTYSGVTTATLTVTATPSAANGHRFRAVATNGVSPDAFSNPATLTVNFAPVVTSAPRSQAVSIGSSLVISVIAIGSPSPTYQWKKGSTNLVDGGRISGATSAALTIANAQAGDEGAYSVVVSNGIAPEATPPAANITLVAAGFGATHAVVGAGYIPSTVTAFGTVTITNTFNYGGELTGLRWAVLLPTGWTFDSAINAGTPASQPEAGLSGLVEWLWSTVPPSGSTFTYTLRAPIGATGSIALAALAEFGVGGDQIQFLGKPDPLVVNPVLYHSADTDSSKWFISGSELLRVITLYNTKFTAVDGTKQRTGAYRIATAVPAPADGFTADVTRPLNTATTLAKYHSADYGTSGVSGTSPPDGQIDGSELLRLITLYNTKYTAPDGTKQRTGAYKIQSGTRDGYGPDPTTPLP